MRALAMTGMVTASMIVADQGRIAHARHAAGRPDVRRHALEGHDRDGPRLLGDRAWSGVTTSMMTPPFSIWARPFLVAQVDVSTLTLTSIDSFVALAREVSAAGSSPARSRVAATSARAIMARAPQGPRTARRERGGRLPETR